MGKENAFVVKQRKKIIQFLTAPREARKLERLSQSEFWKRYGVIQTAGSQYEGGRPIPSSTKLLMALHAAGKFTDDDLAAVEEIISRLEEAPQLIVDAN